MAGGGVGSGAAAAAAAVDRLIADLDARPLDSDVRVGLVIGNALTYRLRWGRLRRVHGDVPGGATTGSGGGNEEAPDDVLVTFRDEASFEELVLRSKRYADDGDLSGAVTALLYELTVPSWVSWSLEAPAIQVFGTAALARLLWAACFQREKPAPAADAGGFDWSKDDLSTGWVMVHNVSPGIKDRVARFQQDLKSVPVNPGAVSEAEDSWMESLIRDLCKTAEDWHELAVNTVHPSLAGGPEPGAATEAGASAQAQAAAGTAAAPAAGCAEAAAAAAPQPPSPRATIRTTVQLHRPLGATPAGGTATAASAVPAAGCRGGAAPKVCADDFL